MAMAVSPAVPRPALCRNALGTQTHRQVGSARNLGSS